MQVALDLVEKLNALLVMRNYEGFIKESGDGATAGGSQPTADAAGGSGGSGWGRRGS